MKKRDRPLQNALKKGYTARAKLFFQRIQRENTGELLDKVKTIDASSIHWDMAYLKIHASVASKVEKAEIPLHCVFCHPDILGRFPELLDYYRNLTALSKKGLSQLFAFQKLAGEEKNLAIARVLNGILSEVLEPCPNLSMDLLRDIMCAELGTEIQGTWVNLIGSGAAKIVENMLGEFAEEKGLITEVRREKIKVGGKRRSQRSIVLKNNWRMIFSPEPDVAIYDPKGIIRIAIEIKGSMDKAGAQTRYGEAKKSFGKTLKANPKCETIYLASVYTDAVTRQIHDNGQVRKTFDLIDILTDEKAKAGFLDEIFKYQIRLDY